jgi:hypothetical protein
MSKKQKEPKRTIPKALAFGIATSKMYHLGGQNQKKRGEKEYPRGIFLVL